MVSTKVYADYLELGIRDTGPGIAADKRITVFEPFYSKWKHATGNAGMGLTIAQEVAMQHGGYIEIDPSFEEGCLIKLRLPLKAPALLLEEADG